MSDMITACFVAVARRKGKRAGQSVCLLFKDQDGDVVARSAISPEVARAIAADLLTMADDAEALALKNAGRLT